MILYEVSGLSGSTYFPTKAAAIESWETCGHQARVYKLSTADLSGRLLLCTVLNTGGWVAHSEDITPERKPRWKEARDG